MATILPFVIRRGNAAQRPGSAGTADVIIFPGVRYERPAGEVRSKGTEGTPRKRKGKTP